MSSRNVLILLTAINLFNYIDRYLLLALMPAIREDITMNHTQAGFVMSAFMLGYMITSPMFGYLADRMSRVKIVFTGTIAWSIISAITGMAHSVSQLFVTRVAVGVGEASTVSTAQALIADFYPKAKRNFVVGIFTAAIPLGAGLGYGLGGVLNHLYGWRMAFILAGLPGVLLALFMLKVKDPPRGQHDDATTHVKPHGFFQDILSLLKNRNYMLSVWSYTTYTFCVGGLGAWAPQYLVETLHMDLAKSNTLFGGITVACGFAGSILGGYWGTLFLKKRKSGDIYFAALTVLIAIPFTFGAFASGSPVFFLISAAVAMFFLFLAQPAINVAIFETANPLIRSTAVAFAVFTIHILGDFISPPLVGFIADRTGSLTHGTLVLPISLIPCVYFLFKLSKSKT